MDEETNPTSRRDILRLMDTFIDQIQAIRRISVGMSVSAIVLAPLAIALFIVLPARKHLLIRFQNCPAKPYTIRSSAVYCHRPFANHLFGPPYQPVCLKILKYGLVFFQVEAAKAYKGSLVQLAVFNKLQNYVLNDVYPVPVRTWRTRQLLCKSESSSI